MPWYRIYLLDQNKRIYAREDVESGNHVSVVIAAAKRFPRFSLEVWFGDRRIAELSGSPGNEARTA